MANNLYEFGAYRIDIRRRRLEREGIAVTLTSKTFDTLLVLVEQHGSNVNRSELMARVWPDTAVGEHNLNQSVATLRKVLDDDPRQPTYIATVPGVGYRFIADVREFSDGLQGEVQARPSESVINPQEMHKESVSHDDQRTPPFSLAKRSYIWAAPLFLAALAILASRWGNVRAAFIPNRPQSVSVLPFANLGNDAQDQYISEGLSQELAAELGQVPTLKVVSGASRSHTSDADVRSLARELSVGTLLKGSIRRSDGQYRIAVQLIDGNDGHQLWANIFSGSASDLPTMEDQIVRHTADVLNVPIAANLDQTIARRAGDNPEAHDLYLQARYFWSKRDLQSMKQSFTLLQQAIAKDPHYARAYAGLADWYGVMAANQGMPVREAVVQARLAAQKALELDPTMAEPHATLGLVNSLVDWDWQGAQLEYNRALLLNPGYGTAHHWAGLNLTAMGRFAEADTELRKAQELDPLSPMISEGRAENFLYWHHFDKAMEVVREMRARERDPSAYALQFAMVEIAQGRYQDAYDEMHKIDPANFDPDVMSLILAQIRALMGDRQNAMSKVKKMEAKFRPGNLTAINIAFVHVALGEPDKAIEWLTRAYRQHDPMLAGIQWQPYLDPLKNDPRFIALMQQIEGQQLLAKN